MQQDSKAGAPEQPAGVSDEQKGPQAGAAKSGAVGAEEATGDPDHALPSEDLVDLPQRFADAEARANENHDRYLRAVAEMENLRRRMQEDVARAHKFGIESFAEALLAVRDSLEMALKTETPSIESLRQGVEMTLRQLDAAFEKNRIVAIDPLGEKFDPNRHQAISTIPSAQASPPTPPNHVAAVLQKGYLIHDRILRPALVIVAQG